MQNLQQQLENKTEDYSRLMQLFNALQRTSDPEAATLLARLRLGESIDSLVVSIETSESSSSACVLWLLSRASKFDSTQFLLASPLNCANIAQNARRHFSI